MHHFSGHIYIFSAHDFYWKSPCPVVWYEVSQGFVYEWGKINKYWFLQYCGLFTFVVVGKKRNWTSRNSFLFTSWFAFLPSSHGHKIWSMTKRMKLQIQVVERSFHSRVDVFSFTEMVKSSIILERVGIEQFHIERSQLKRFRHLIRVLPGHLHQVFQPCPTGRRRQGRPRKPIDYVSRLAWEHIWVLPEEVVVKRGMSVPPYSSCCPATWLQNKWHRMDGWSYGGFSGWETEWHFVLDWMVQLKPDLFQSLFGQLMHPFVLKFCI